MDADALLSQLTIPTPCPADWDAMRGDDRIRFCDSCGKHVYNLSSMTSGEAEDLVRGRGGKLCARFYRRPDGTLVTADCPSPRGATSRRQFSLRAMMALIAGTAGAFGLAKLFARQEPVPMPLMGEIVCPPPAPPPAGPDDPYEPAPSEAGR
jgi:hypothetical protein